MKVRATYVGTLTVTDPDTQAPVDLQVYKDPESEGMFAVDVSFLDQETCVVPSPFNEGTKLVCLEPGMDEAEELESIWTHQTGEDDFDETEDEDW